jgi:uncharacterized RDD family membrane protein YckC
MRFDEMELEAVPLGVETPEATRGTGAATRMRRLFALLTDLSLFAALVVALLPLAPQSASWTHRAALGGFALIVSYYYFVGAWLLWGRTVGGVIFDVRVVDEPEGAITWVAASARWAGMLLSILLAGLGFLLAALPSQRSLPDRLSGTRCV